MFIIGCVVCLVIAFDVFGKWFGFCLYVGCLCFYWSIVEYCVYFLYMCFFVWYLALLCNIHVVVCRFLYLSMFWLY